MNAKTWDRRSACREQPLPLETDPTEVVLGLGSAHGDDQFGWAVIDQLTDANLAMELRKIRHPIDIVSWLDAKARVHLVDAALGLPGDRTLWQLHFCEPSDRAQIEQLPITGTHDMGIYQALMVAESLGKYTDHVSIWLGQAIGFDPLAPISEVTQVSLQACVKELTRSLRRA